MHISERRACAALGQHRSTQRKVPRGRHDEEQLTADLIALARQYGRYGYRKIAGLLEQAGWIVNDKRVERIWRREGLKVPHKQPKRGRLWLVNGSCNRLRPEHRNHVWSYDFVEDRTHNGQKYRMLNVIDEFTHECLAIRVARIERDSIEDALYWDTLDSYHYVLLESGRGATQYLIVGGADHKTGEVDDAWARFEGISGRESLDVSSGHQFSPFGAKRTFSERASEAL
jgi:hypothetical protein